MARGRPTKSQIRQNMIEILAHIKAAYGYDIYKVYISIFPKVTIRSIYYHLKKGVSLGEFIVAKIEKEKGDYSWGGEAEKIYYSLGPQAKVQGSEEVKRHFLGKASAASSSSLTPPYASPS